jgi:hypothetical protein
MNEMTEQEKMIFIPAVLFQRWFYELTFEDLKRFGFTLMEYVKVRKLISTGRNTRVNDKTVFKFLKIWMVNLYSTDILKHQSNKERPSIL